MSHPLSDFPPTQMEAKAAKLAARSESKESKGGEDGAAGASPHDELLEDFLLGETFDFGPIFHMFFLALDRLQAELYKSLQFATKEMQEYLIEGQRMVPFLKELLCFVVVQHPVEASGVASKLLELLYYKTDADNQLMVSFIKEQLKVDDVEALVEKALAAAAAAEAGAEGAAASATAAGSLPKSLAEVESRVGNWSFEGGQSFKLLLHLADIVERGATDHLQEQVLAIHSE